MTRRSAQTPSIVSTTHELVQRLGREERRLKPRDPSLLRDQTWEPPGGGSGSCLTATTPDRDFNPDSLAGGFADTGLWTVRTAMNLVRLEVRTSAPPSGDDAVLEIYASSSTLTATATLSDGVDTYDSWTGEESIGATETLYLAIYSTVSLEGLVAQAWFDGPGGGGLIFWPAPGA